ncbi:MAG TPA: glycosyltransferase family 39 protein [Chthonomonadaceae bacterium]|nr:glycosyltransferase family 39 protein [Chthonomonadaceae bacterium]
MRNKQPRPPLPPQERAPQTPNRALVNRQALPTPSSTAPESSDGISPWLPAFACDPRWHRATLLFLAVTTLLRLLQLPTLELAPDEAYYWDWSRHLSLGYYDQGPMIAYLIRATTALFGTNTLGVRFGVLLASLGTLLCCYALARRIASPLAGFLTVVLLGLTPMLTIGSVIATYDPPMVFFWALTLVALERALFAASERTQRSAWLGAGLASGLGLLSKHTMLLIVPCLLLFLLLSPPHRRWLLRPEPYLAFVLTLLLYSGVFWWNARHHWWTFGHLLILVGKTPGTPLSRLGEFLGSQALLFGPVLFLGALWAGVGALSGKRAAPPHSPVPTSPLLFLACMGLPVLGFFCLMSFKSKVQANWAPNAWLTPTILWAIWLTLLAGRGRQARQKAARLFALTAATSGLLTAVILFPHLRLWLGLRLPPGADLSNTTYGWRQLAARVQQLRQEMERGGRRKVFIAGNGYQYPALMAFYLPDHPETYDMFLHFRLTMYAAYVDRLKQRLGQDAIFINDGEVDDRDLREVFERVEWELPLPIWRRPLYNEPIRFLHIARCYNYRRYVGLDWAQGG